MADEDAAPGTPPDGPRHVARLRRPGLGALTGIVIAAVTIAALDFGRNVLIPITLAVMLSFVLSPLMAILRRLRIGRVAAALLAVTLAIGVILGVGGIIGTQIAGLVGQVPQYQTTISAKAASLQRLIGTVLPGRIGAMVQRIESVGVPGPAAPIPEAARSSAAAQSAAPVRVIITESSASSALDLGERILTPVLHPILSLGIILVVTVFVLLQKDDVRDRLIRLLAAGDLHRATAAINDAGRRLTRYFLTQLAINCSFGVIIGIGLFLIGVPSPVLWGVLAALLRFLPYIGSYIAAALPVLLAAAVGHGWLMVFWTVMLYGVTELIIANAVEPTMYSHSTGLSPLAVIIAAIFWTWLWGPIGLILSTPLTLCLVVLGRHIDQLEFLDVLLGDRPALSPVENFYQRILAGDPDEAEELAERFLEQHSLSEYYDQVALEGLQLATADANRGVLAPEQIARIMHAVAELVHDLAGRSDADPRPARQDETAIGRAPGHARNEERPGAPPSDAKPPATDALRPEWQTAAPVLCIPGRGPLDEAVSSMLAQLLQKHDIGSRSIPHEAVSRARIAGLDAPDVAMVCILYLDIAGNPAHLRFLVRRIRERLPKVPVLVGIWSAADPFLKDQAAQEAVGADYYVSALGKALNACLRAARPDADPTIPRQPRTAPRTVPDPMIAGGMRGNPRPN